MEKVTAEQVEEAVKKYNIKSWVLRNCSLCEDPLSYLFHEGLVLYDANCSCVNYWNPHQKRSYAELAETFNIQTPEHRASMWMKFLESGEKT